MTFDTRPVEGKWQEKTAPRRWDQSSDLAVNLRRQIISGNRLARGVHHFPVYHFQLAFAEGFDGGDDEGVFSLGAVLADEVEQGFPCRFVLGGVYLEPVYLLPVFVERLASDGEGAIADH